MARRQSDERLARTAREEMALFLFRGFTPEQQRESLLKMHALFEANQFTQKKLGNTLRTVSNETVRALFKDVPPVIPGRGFGDRRPPDAPMDDYPEPGEKR